MILPVDPVWRMTKHPYIHLQEIQVVRVRNLESIHPGKDPDEKAMSFLRGVWFRQNPLVSPISIEAPTRRLLVFWWQIFLKEGTENFCDISLLFCYYNLDLSQHLLHNLEFSNDIGRFPYWTTRNKIFDLKNFRYPPIFVTVPAKKLNWGYKICYTKKPISIGNSFSNHIVPWILKIIYLHGSYIQFFTYNGFFSDWESTQFNFFFLHWKKYFFFFFLIIFCFLWNNNTFVVFLKQSTYCCKIFINFKYFNRKINKKLMKIFQKVWCL